MFPSPSDYDNFEGAPARFGLTKRFLGRFDLKSGVYAMGGVDIVFGILMAASYFREVEIPLTLAGCTRIASGLWCLSALACDNQTMINLYLLLLLFNNCLVLAVCIAFLILLSSESMIVCNIPLTSVLPGEALPSCPLIHREGFWEVVVTTGEFVLYLYFLYVMISYLKVREATTTTAAVEGQSDLKQRLSQTSSRASSLN